MPEQDTAPVVRIPIFRVVGSMKGPRDQWVRKIVAHAEIDDDDAEYAGGFTWWLRSIRGSTEIRYAFRRLPHLGKDGCIHMHSDLWIRHHGEIADGLTVDHRDRDGLNNRKSNFRLATRSQQLINQGLDGTNTTGFKGVTWKAREQRYSARITKDDRQIYLMVSTIAAECGLAYNVAAEKLYGEFAWLNPIPEGAITPDRAAEITAWVKDKLAGKHETRRQFFDRSK